MELFTHGGRGSKLSKIDHVIYGRPLICIVVFAIAIAPSVHSFPKGSKGGGGIKSGIKSVFKGKSSSKSHSSSSSSDSSFFGTTTTPPASTYTTTTTTRRSTTTTARPISDQEFYEKIRSSYCNSGSKISLEEIEAAVTCPVNGFTFQLFSTLASSINSSTPEDKNSTTNSTTTTTPSSTTISTDTSLANTTTLSTSQVLTNTSSDLEMTCQSFNSTCFEKMHTFVNECLTTGSTSPLAEAYQFDLYLREEACVRNKTTIIDDWTNGTEKCLSPYFLKDGNVLRRAVAECKRRHPTSEVKLSHGYSNKILACVKDRINAPSCICHWGTDGCNPTAMLMRNYYVESVVSLLLFVERPQ